MKNPSEEILQSVSESQSVKENYNVHTIDLTDEQSEMLMKILFEDSEESE